MTYEQKTEIGALRQKGLGYKKIAAKVGISENTVKSYLRRIEAASAEKRAENPFVIERIITPDEGDEQAEPLCQEIITPAQGEVDLFGRPSELFTEDEEQGTSGQTDPEALYSSMAEDSSSSEESLSHESGNLLPVTEDSSPDAIITSSASESRTAPCLYCGKEVPQRDGRKEKKFCSSGCRVKWWNRHKNTIPRKSSRLARCPSCGKQFYAYGPQGRKYCSHSCYITGRFAKQKETA